MLRGEHFGHKKIGKTPQELFKKAGLNIRHVDEMFDVATRIISLLIYPLGIRAHEVILDADKSARESLDEILEMLLDRFNALGAKP